MDRDMVVEAVFTEINDDTDDEDDEVEDDIDNEDDEVEDDIDNEDEEVDDDSDDNNDNYYAYINDYSNEVVYEYDESTHTYNDGNIPAFPEPNHSLHGNDFGYRSLRRLDPREGWKRYKYKPSITYEYDGKEFNNTDDLSEYYSSKYNKDSEGSIPYGTKIVAEVLTIDLKDLDRTKVHFGDYTPSMFMII